MTPQHYLHISRHFDAYLATLPAPTRPKVIEEAQRYTSFMWSLTYTTGLTRFICDELYQYLDDTHIQTALRKYFNSLPAQPPKESP